MTPLKLTFAAFGPFRQKQALDFSELGGSRMFLITGKTGAGKTTLFDAICYALYGEASGALRRADQLKSDFAGPDERCFVEFTFETNGRVYTVSRAPTQQLSRLRGEGERTVQTTASLRYDTGEEIAGVSTVNSAVAEILGISAEQFRKIVLLPQGEFRSFLDADSRKRQEIFRSIFNTQIFAAFTEELKARETALKERYDSALQLLSALVRTIPLRSEALDILLARDPLPFPAIREELSRLIGERKKETARMREELDALSRKRAGIRLEEARLANRKLAECAESRAALETLAARAPEMEREKALLGRLAGVKLLKIREDAVAESERKLAAVQLEQERTKAAYGRILPQMQAAESALRKAQAEQERLPALQAEKAELGRIREKLGELAKREAEQKALSAKRQHCVQRAEILKLLRQRCQSAEKAKKSAAAADSLDALEQELSRSFHAKSAHDAAKRDYLTGYSHFLDGQAGILAQDLRDGSPCPVCGAVHHPAPAPLAQDTPSQNEVDRLRRLAEQAAERVSAAGAAVTQAWQKASLLLEAEGTAIPSLKEIEDNSTLLEAAVEPARRAAQAAENERISAEEALFERKVGQKIWGDRKFQDLDYIEKKLEELRQEYAECSGSMQAAMDAAAQLAGEIPPAYSSMEPLQAREAAIDREAASLAGALERANRELRESAAEESRLSGLQKALAGQAEEAEADRAARQADFERHFAEAGYTGMEGYRADLRELPFFDRRQKEYDAFQERLARARAVAERLAAETEGMTPYPLEEMTAQADALDREIRELTSRAAEWEAALKTADETAGRIAREEEKLAALTEQYQTASALYKAASGNNPMAISFERYVLSGFFDQIVQSANLRLQKMSSGRYSLSRKGEKGKGRRPAGLDLEVLDVNTGKFRDTATLSGGESFLTALSLALAVAEVITRYSGGVEINTMLIDEGFGSLDADSLEVAMDALQQLQGGSRLIGIISHVETLAHYIPAKLAVTASRQGSSARFLC